MADKKVYIPRTEIFSMYGLTEDRRTIANYGASRVLRFYPCYRDEAEGQWYYHVEAFGEFMAFCQNQGMADISTEPKVYIEEIREEYDDKCPFTQQQLGNLFCINAICGKLENRGVRKVRKKIALSSYYALKQFYIEALHKYHEELKNIPIDTPRYGY